MENLNDWLENGFNIVFFQAEHERDKFLAQFLSEHPEYNFEMRLEFMDMKKKLFHTPRAFEILKKNKTIRKTKSNEDIVYLLRKMEIMGYSNLAPRVMRFEHRLMYSVAYELLEKNKRTFLISEGRDYDEDTLLYIAKCVNAYAKTDSIKFVFFATSCFDYPYAASACNGLFEVDGGNLIKHDVNEL